MATVSMCVFMVLTTLAILAGTEADNQDSIFNKVKKTKTIATINNEVTYVPPMIILGLKNGTIIRCPHARPSSCEVYHVGSSPVTATVVHGEFLFASLASGVILRCRWQKTHSCYIFHQTNTEMTGLAVATGFIYAGLRNGTILRCELNTPHSYEVFANLESNRHIRFITAFGSVIYAGSDNGRIDLCSEGRCHLFCQETDSEITELVAMGYTVYGVTEDGFVNSGTQNSKNCNKFQIDGSGYRHMTIFDRNLYVIQDPGIVYVINEAQYSRSQFVRHDGAVSISFAYGTYAMRNQYRLESKKCIWKGNYACPPTVIYYDVNQRFTLEVSVENGSLYNSQGDLVDTSNEDESYSQKAAIFVMGPDGQLLLSNVHKTGLLHTSSLLAGNPVSGAGLMVVKQGKIKSITACSVHYRAETELNNQVIEALHLKGYTDPIDSFPCSYNSMLRIEDNNNNGNMY